MDIRNSTHATITRWTEYRTPSGRWSKVKHNPQKLEFGHVELHNFFTWYPEGQRVEYGYFREGYLPWRVTVPSPYGTMRHVYIFNYWTEEAQ